MKEIRLKSSLLAGLMALAFFPNFRKGELKDVAKPYLGIYECTEAKFNEEDYLNRFSYIHLELKSDETFLLHYCEKGGKKRTEQGKYTYDREKGTVTLQGGVGSFLKREFPLREGILTVVIPFGEQTLGLKFEQK